MLKLKSIYIFLFTVCLLPDLAFAKQQENPATQPKSAQIGDSPTEIDTPLGRRVKNFELLDYRGTEHSLEDFDRFPVLVVAFLGTECPLAKLYGPRLEKMAELLEPQGVGFVGIIANSQDSITEMAAYAHRHGIDFPLLKDLGNKVSDQMGAERTPEVFVLDRERVIRYWGRIDDQYGVGYVRQAPKQYDLQNAIDELLAGKTVSKPITKAVGCLIGRVRKTKADAEVTYSNQIARVLQNHCVECHRKGEIAPIELTEYDEVAGWADMIEEVVRQQRMPPWFASGEYSHFKNDRHMSDEEKQLIYNWVEAGAPEGNPDDLPEPRDWITGWQLPREPDFVAPITAEPFVVPADGEVEYQYFRIDPGFTEDKWISAIEIRPGNRAVVHHVLMFSGEAGDVARDIRRKFRGGVRGYDGAYIPGQRVHPYPEGTAKRIAAGSQLVFQVHYTPIGSEQLDQSRVGMIFVDESTVQYEVHTSSAVNNALDIPPNEADYRVEAGSPRIPEGVRLLSFLPHMHLRGKSFFYEAVYPGGKREPLLDVPQYDFNWQIDYRLQQPQQIPAGTRIHCVAHFDNSEDNLVNPDPTKRVHWGDQTWDEMMIGYFSYTQPVGIESSRAAQDSSQNRLNELFAHLDRNLDEQITRDEVPGRFEKMFDLLDKNKDDQLSFEELQALKVFR